MGILNDLIAKTGIVLMRNHITVTALLIAFLSPCALANSEFSPAYSICTSNSGGNTSELNDCGHTELANQNARLDKAYNSAMTALSTEKKRALRDAQVLWVKFRDADCGMYYSLTGGTMDLLEGVGCELSMTLERADSLEWLAKNGAEHTDEVGETDAW